MCRTQKSGAPHCDYPTAACTEHLHTNGWGLTSPNILVGLEPAEQVSTQPTLERAYEAPNIQLGMSLVNVNPSLDIPQS
jgi:hypothetical protein